MSGRRRATLSVLVAVAIAAVVTGAILLFGVKHVPSFPDVADEPEPALSGTIAYVSWGDDGPCLHVRPAAGGEGDERVRCDPQGATGVAFRADGTLVVHQYGPGGILETVLDPATLAVLDEKTLPAESKVVDGGMRRDVVNAAGERVSVRRDGDGAWSVVVRRGTADEVLLSVRGPDDYWLGDVWWSPDGRWVVVVDAELRSLVVPGDGVGGTRVLARDAQELQWYQPGYAPPT